MQKCAYTKIAFNPYTKMWKYTPPECHMYILHLHTYNLCDFLLDYYYAVLIYSCLMGHHDVSLNTGINTRLNQWCECGLVCFDDQY